MREIVGNILHKVFYRGVPDEDIPVKSYRFKNGTVILKRGYKVIGRGTSTGSHDPAVRRANRLATIKKIEEFRKGRKAGNFWEVEAIMNGKEPWVLCRCPKCQEEERKYYEAHPEECLDIDL